MNATIWLLSLPAVLLIAVALLVRRRSNLGSVVLVGLPVAHFPIALTWFSSTRTIINGFRELATSGKGSVEGVASQLNRANDMASAGLVASALALLFLLGLAIAALLRGPSMGNRASGPRIAIVLTLASIPLLLTLGLYALGSRTTVTILAVVVPEETLADPRLPLAREAAAAMRFKEAKVEDVSAALARRLAASALGAFGLFWLSPLGFVANWALTSKSTYPRFVSAVGLVLVLLAVSATAAQIYAHRAVVSEIEYVAAWAGVSP